jgi:hypothetical protein
MAISDDDFAAAMMAKLAGSTLKEIDDNTTQRAGNTGPALKLDPLSFISTTGGQSIKQNTQQQLINEANRLAEQLHPLPPLVQAAVPQHVSAPSVHSAPPQPSTPVATSELIDTIKTFNTIFDRFVTAYENRVSKSA